MRPDPNATGKYAASDGRGEWATDSKVDTSSVSYHFGIIDIALQQREVELRSHTVPQKLLEQFAFYDPQTQSKRLWCYEKLIPPYKVSPRSATRWDKHFADPKQTATEAELELRLKQEFEEPVNGFIEQIQDKTFVLGVDHVRALTNYITILFHRSTARRTATEVQHANQIAALKAVLNDDEVLSLVAAKMEVTIDDPRYELTKEAIVEVIHSRIDEGLTQESVQNRYIQTMNTMMSYVDENMLNGEWRIIRTDLRTPFVIGDAPVVTWERLGHGLLVFGQGFSRSNVEVFLPVHPTTCLHILPDVDRYRPVQVPRADEINMVQAAFASRQCFSSLNSGAISAFLEPHFSTCRIGIDGFRLTGFDFKQKMIEILTKQKPLLR